MTARTVFEAAVVSANVTKVATNQASANTHQETIAASHHNVGYNNATGNFAALDTATKAANVAYQVAKQKAAHDAQVAITNARATLQATGDTGPG